MPIFSGAYVKEKHNLPISVDIELTKLNPLGVILPVPRKEAIEKAYKIVNKTIDKLLCDIRVEENMFWVMEKFTKTSRKIQLV